MHFSLAGWFLISCISAISNAAGILEVDLVFPSNETYAPTDRFPIVFAFQNSGLARLLAPRIWLTIRNSSELISIYARKYSHDLGSADWSSHDPFFTFNYFHDLSEGHYQLEWSVNWQSCDENGSGPVDLVQNSSHHAIKFTLDDSAPPIDLIAATANKTTCPKELGVAINVTDQTMELGINKTCAVVASSTPTSTPDPCRVNIDSATSASMAASWHEKLCRGVNPPPNCPDESAAQRLVTGISCFASLFGIFGFFLI